MQTVNGKGDLIAHVSAGQMGRVMVSAAKGCRAANMELKSNDEVAPFVKALAEWLEFGPVFSRSLVVAILAERANG